MKKKHARECTKAEVLAELRVTIQSLKESHREPANKNRITDVAVLHAIACHQAAVNFIFINWGDHKSAAD